MIKFCITDGRPWYKQIISGAITTAVLLLLSVAVLTLGIIGFALLENFQKILAFFAFAIGLVFAVFIIGVIYDWSKHGSRYEQ